MSCYSKQILELFYNVQNTGRIIKPEAIGKAGSKAEGTVIEFSWRVRDGIIQDARFRTFGDVNAIAISSVLTTMMIGKTIDEVLSIRAEDILEHLFDSKPNYLYLTDLALSALGKTYENYEKRNNKVERKQSAISQKLKSDLEKIEAGEIDVDLDNLDLSDISSLEEAEDEEEYLRNLNSYEKTVEENSLEKSLQRLFAYTEKPKSETSSTATRGRGRPRKERTPEEIEAEQNREKRGRGRPRKERTPEEIEAELNKVKRGRGRPRKESLVADNSVVETKPTYSFAFNSIQPANEIYKQKEETVKPTYDLEDDEEDDFGVDMFSSFTYNNKPSKHTEIKDDVIIEEENIYEDYEEETEDAQDIIKPVTPTFTFNSTERRGRGRPRKERTPEEIEAELNKVKRGRGRPKKERTPEEIEAELNKEKRGRGRPRKNPIDIEEDNTDKISRGRGRPRKERTPEEIEAELNKVKRGRGRPKKELTEEELQELQNKVKRGRGRPKKDTAFVIQSVKPVADTKTTDKNEHFEEKIVEKEPEPTKEVEVENNITNSFAPANNKFSIGKPSMPYYSNTTTTTYKKVETKTNFYTNIKETYNVVSEENTLGGGNEQIKPQHDTIKVESNVVEPNKVELDENVKELLQDDKEPENVEPLSENVNNILQQGGSIEDALKFLLDN